MNVALRKPTTLERFLEWEQRRESRYEFDGVQPVVMSGDTYRHDCIDIDPPAALLARLRGMSCRARSRATWMR